jgi:hypothetical protein
MGHDMRSQYVFDATKKINCRFLLCRVASISARRLQKNSNHPSESINESLRLIAAAAVAEDKRIVGDELPSASNGGLPPEVRPPKATGLERIVEPQLDAGPAVGGLTSQTWS